MYINKDAESIITLLGNKSRNIKQHKPIFEMSQVSITKSDNAVLNFFQKGHLIYNFNNLE